MKWCLPLLILATSAIFYTNADQAAQQLAKMRHYCKKYSDGLVETNNIEFIQFFIRFRDQCDQIGTDFSSLSEKKKKNSKLDNESWLEKVYCQGLSGEDLWCKEYECIKNEGEHCASIHTQNQP